MSETDKILNDIRTYLRISAAAAAKSVAKVVIDTLEKAQVYEKLAEGKSQQKIEAETGIAQTTVSGWISKFVEAGLVSPPNDYLKAYKALFTLRELGINPLELKRKKKEQTGVAASKPDTSSKGKEEGESQK